MLSRTILGILLITWFTSLNAQYVTLRGNVTAEGWEGLPYVNVYMEGTDYGTATNRNGDFELLIYPEDYKRRIVFSYLGFNTEYLTADSSQVYHVYLKESEIILNDFVVTPVDPTDVISDFQESIAKNYQTDPLIQRVFVREHEELENGDPIVHHEFMADYYRKNYIGANKDKIRHIKSRTKSYLNLDTIDYAYLEGGTALILNDIVKYPREFIDPDKLKRYDLELNRIIEFDGEQVYQIDFKPNPNKGNSRYEGSLYITKESNALVKATIRYSQEGLAWINSDRFTPGFKWHEVENTLFYKKLTDGTYALNEMVVSGIGEDEYNFDQRIRSISELIVVESKYNADTQKKSFKSIKNNTAIYELGEFEDLHNLWQDFNHMIYEEPDEIILTDTQTY